MSIEITVPRLGWSMEEGSFCRWLKSDGDMVREGDELFELEGDKATQIVESFDAGILRIPVDGPRPGDIVKVGQVLGHLEPRSRKSGGVKEKAPSGGAQSPPANGQGVAAAAEPASPPPEAAPTSARPAEVRAASRQAPLPNLPSPNLGALPSPVVASPSVRRLARELGVDLLAIRSDQAHPVSASDVLRTVGGDIARPPASSAGVPSPPKTNRPVTPRARRIAQELGVNLPDAVGSGRNGRIREQDIRAAATSGTRPRLVETISTQGQALGAPISNLRRVIAQRMMAASHETAPVTLTARADASELVHFREQCKQTSVETGVKLPGYTELFVKLSAAALQKHPVLLDQWIDERIAPPDGIHIAVAVATPHGLVTPVIRDAPHLSLRELSGTFAQLVELARTQRLSVEQMRGGAFTVSSLGGYRVDAFTPILNPPQTAILGVGRISEQPVVREKQLAVAEVVSLSLTFDHRVVDGAPAAAFLTTLCEMIERPLGWLLA